MVDRKARALLIETIERYLLEQISAFEFDDAVATVRQGTEDGTVRQVSDWLWFHYDDIVDHPVVASKEQWDWFQRILLVLRSDQELVRLRRSRWTVRQPVAALGVVAFATAAAILGFTEQLLLVCPPLGCVSASLWWWRRRDESGGWRDLELIFPFSSIGEMLGVRRRARGFAKRQYPEHLGSRRIRGRLSEFAMWLQFIPLWLFVSPLVLLAQAFPEDASRWSVSPKDHRGTEGEDNCHA